MTINAQSGEGRIRLFYDFFGADAVANTGATRALGPFSVAGDGSEDTDAGVPVVVSDALSGVGAITTTNETEHCTLVGLPTTIDVALMGPIILEARVRFVDLDTKESFIGVSDIPIDTLCIEDDVAAAATETFTLTASDICGFYLSAELTEDEMWHAIHNGGTTTGVTDTTALEFEDAVVGEWQILRLEIDPNGTARWYIDGKLWKTLEGAVSTTTDLSLMVGVEAKGNAIELMHIDYLLVEMNRDWNA